MSTHSPTVAVAIIAALGAASNCHGAPAEPPAQERAQFFTYENDAHFSTDRYYTSGVQFSIKRASDRHGRVTGRFASGISGALCAALGCSDSQLLSTQYNLGQLIYTPRDITRSAAQRLDRPWAGLLYYEQTYAFLSPDQRTLTTLSGQLGVTGALSLAEPSQKLFHRLLDRPRPEGWDNQIGGAVGLLASAERRSAFDALSGALGQHVRLNTAAYWRIAAGNIQTYAAAGMAVVIGKDLPPVSPPPPGIGNKVAAHPHASAGATSCLAPWLQCTAFGSVEGRVVAYNVFLDGRPGSADPDVKRRNFVHDLVAGTRFDFPNTRSASHGPWVLQFKITRRSKEFRSSLPVHRHRVAALTIGTEF
jgi:lipid A 3-O-deacylase